MEGQEDWDAHASFMNALEREGFVVLGGPLECTRDVLLIVRARTSDEIIDRLGRPGPSSREPRYAVDPAARLAVVRDRRSDKGRLIESWPSVKNSSSIAVG